MGKKVAATLLGLVLHTSVAAHINHSPAPTPRELLSQSKYCATRFADDYRKRLFRAAHEANVAKSYYDQALKFFIDAKPDVAEGVAEEGRMSQSRAEDFYASAKRLERISGCTTNDEFTTRTEEAYHDFVRSSNSLADHYHLLVRSLKSILKR